jgi:predicted type IV restriction endonuclease
MRSHSFGEFLTKKRHEAVKKLDLVRKLLESQGFRVNNFLDEDFDDNEPYIYCFNPVQTPDSFEGIRIYRIGNEIAFRTQKQDKTHPYGKAYTIPIEELFEYFLEDMDEKKAGEEIIKVVSKEVKKFFEKSIRAEQELSNLEIAGDSVIARTTGTDYSNQVFNKTP